MNGSHLIELAYVIGDFVLVPLNMPIKRHGRRSPKCIEFDKLQKHEKILLKINVGQTTSYCPNATMFTTQMTWRLKHHADVSYAQWTNVPMEENDELIERVRVSHDNTCIYFFMAVII